MFEEGMSELHRHTLPVVWTLVLRDAEENGRSIGGWGRENDYRQILYDSIIIYILLWIIIMFISFI